MLYDELPDVLLDEDLARALRTSERTVQRRRAQHALPIPELPSIDRRHRYGKPDVIRYLERQATGASVRRRRP